MSHTERRRRGKHPPEWSACAEAGGVRAPARGIRRKRTPAVNREKGARAVPERGNFNRQTEVFPAECGAGRRFRTGPGRKISSPKRPPEKNRARRRTKFRTGRRKTIKNKPKNTGPGKAPYSLLSPAPAGSAPRRPPERTADGRPERTTVSAAGIAAAGGRPYAAFGTGRAACRSVWRGALSGKRGSVLSSASRSRSRTAGPDSRGASYSSASYFLYM